MTQRSKAHHYLPRCYLKGFTHNGSQLYLYDKKEDKIRPGNIKNSFRLWNRNTWILNDGRKLDSLEQIYSKIESETAYLFPQVINSTPNKEALTYWDKLQLSVFIMSLFWRVPARDQFIKELLKNGGMRNTHFSFKYPEGWSESDKEKFMDLILKNENFKKSYPLLLSFEPYYKKDYSEFINSWKIYYQDPGFLFAGDNPLVMRSSANPQSILDEFIFPLAPNRLLVASKSKPKSLDPEWTIKVNFQLIRQAERHVCSNNLDYLRAIVNLYKLSKKTENEKDFIDSLFGSVS